MSEQLRRHILATAARLLENNGCAPIDVRVVIRGGLRGRTRLYYAEDGPIARTGSAPFSVEEDGMSELLVRCFLNETERDAVIALADGPLPAKTIAKRLGFNTEEVPTKLKNYLTGLAERGVLVVQRDGYTLADHRFAEVAKLLAQEAELAKEQEPPPVAS